MGAPRKRHGNALAEMVTLWGAAWQAGASAPSAVVPSHRSPQEPTFQVIRRVSETPMEARTGPCPISKGGGQEHPESITGEKPQPRVPRIRLLREEGPNVEQYRQPNGDKTYHGDYEKTDLEEGQRREEYGGWTGAIQVTSPSDGLARGT